LNKKFAAALGLKWNLKRSIALKMKEFTIPQQQCVEIIRIDDFMNKRIYFIFVEVDVYIKKVIKFG
jgi:hypothetical protein